MAQGRVLPYLDVPFQHSHPEVLKAHEAPASGEKNLERRQLARGLPEHGGAQHLHRRLPGETEAEFEHLLDFIREAQIDHAGCFAYSPVEGAAANELPGLLSAELREGAPRALHGGGRRRSTRKLAARVGATMQVLVDHAPALGRRGGVGACSYADARPRSTVRAKPAAAREGVQKTSRSASSRAPASCRRRPRPVGAAI